jgi:hypothetical protein
MPTKRNFFLKLIICIEFMFNYFSVIREVSDEGVTTTDDSIFRIKDS